MIFGWNFDAKMGGLDMQKQAFPLILVVKYEFSGSCDIYRKLMPKTIQKQLQIEHFEAIGSDF